MKIERDYNETLKIRDFLERNSLTLRFTDTWNTGDGRKILARIKELCFHDGCANGGELVGVGSTEHDAVINLAEKISCRWLCIRYDKEPPTEIRIPFLATAGWDA